jgi:acetoin utilization protein AcuC
MDALSGDPLTHLGLTNNAYATMVERIVAFGPPVLATGGGGYHVANTARGWALLWGVMTGDDMMDDASLALGGIMLESSEWAGGLRDRERTPTPAQRAAVEPAVAEAVAAVKRRVFPYHGIA